MKLMFIILIALFPAFAIGQKPLKINLSQSQKGRVLMVGNKGIIYATPTDSVTSNLQAVTDKGNLTSNQITTTKSGNGTGSGFYAWANAPSYAWQSNSASSNAKIWDQVVSGDNMFFRVLNDAQDAADTWLQIARTGATVTGIDFNGHTVRGKTESQTDVSTKLVSTELLHSFVRDSAGKYSTAGLDSSGSAIITTTNANPTTILSIPIGFPRGYGVQWRTIGFKASNGQMIDVQSHVPVSNIGAGPVIRSGGQIDIFPPQTDPDLSTASVDASVSGNNLIIQVTGVASTTINWKITFSFQRL
jgi:hypothetical protein